MNARLAPATVLPLAALLLAAPLLAGCASDAVAVTQIRVDFAGQREERSDSLPAASIARAAQPYYDDAQVQHPAYDSAFDQLAAWSKRSGVPIEVTHFPFGFCVDRIGGLPTVAGCSPQSTAYWSLGVNGTEALVGMEEVRVVDGSRIAWILTSLTSSAAPSASSPPASSSAAAPPSPAPSATVEGPSPPRLDLPARAVAKGAVTVNGTATPGATLRFEPGNGTLAQRPDGSFSYRVGAAPGHSRLAVVAETAGGTARAEVLLVRLAPATVQVRFGGYPGHADRDDLVWYDPGGNASAAMYAGKDLAHPAYANVHDLLVEWTDQAGVPVQYGYSNGLGFSVQKIDGVGVPLDGSPASNLYWCYDYNGASATMGITGQQLKPGDTVAWSLGCSM